MKRDRPKSITFQLSIDINIIWYSGDLLGESKFRCSYHIHSDDYERFADKIDLLICLTEVIISLCIIVKHVINL